MRFRIDSRIFERFPGLNIGVLVAKGIDNTGIDEDVINLIRDMENSICERFNRETLSQDPKINAWRNAYSSFKAKPKNYKCSVENLYRMILDSIELRHINRIVDIYNYISIKHMIPVGGDDIDRIDGDIRLTFAKGDEPFVELNSKEIKNPKEGEVIYSDDNDVLCRRWNWRECDKSKMTEATRDVVVVAEGLPPFKRDDVDAIIRELSVMVRKYCGGDVKTHILNKDMAEIDV